MSADLIGDDACREAFNKARQQRFSVHGLDVVCEPDIFRAGYAAGRDSEIAKRGARMAELEQELQAGATAVENCELFRAELAAIKAQEPVAWVGTIEYGVPLLMVEPQNWKATPLYAAPVSEAKAQVYEPLVCDYCNAETQDPWHGSGILNGVESRHIHACSQCRNLLPTTKAQCVVMPAELDRAFITSESCDGVYRVAIQSETLKEMQAIHNWLARLNAAHVQRVSVPASAFASRAITHYEAALLAAFPSGSSGEVFNQWNEARRVLAAAPAAPAADAGIVDMYRHLQKVTPYRFKKIQDAAVTDGGDVLYFHKDRFDAALLDDMAAHSANGVV